MASHLSSIGFPSTREAFDELAQTTLRRGERIDAGTGAYVRWRPGGGPELWLQLQPGSDGHEQIVGLNPFFAGSARMRVGITGAVRDTQHPLDGRLEGWAGPTTDNPDSGDYPCSFDLPDFEVASEQLTLPTTCVVGLAGFAHSIRCWPDESSYEREHSEPGHMAARSFIPVGQFANWKGPIAAGFFTGQVLETALKVNPAGTGRYYHAKVETLGGEIDVVADPSICAVAPTPGGLLQATCWLTGRLRL